MGSLHPASCCSHCPKLTQESGILSTPLPIYSAFPVVGAEVVVLSEDVVDVALTVVRAGFAEVVSVDSLSSRALTSRKW